MTNIIILLCLLTLVVISAMTLVFAVAAFPSVTLPLRQRQARAKRLKSSAANISKLPLDHDIKVNGARKLLDEVFTGLCPWVGPSPASWPIANPQKWEVTLYDDDSFYYARLIFHEYVLWLSFDYPYMLVKLPKTRVPSGYDMTKRDDQLRLMWNWTYQNMHAYNHYTDLGFAAPVLNSINGHSVEFTGHDTYTYNKYVLLSDESAKW